MSNMGGGQRSSASQNENSNTNYSGQTSSFTSLPDWLNQAGPDVYNRASGFADNYDPINPLVQQTGGLANYIGGYGAPGYDMAAGYYGLDRGGGYAQTAIERLLGASNGMGGAPGGTATNPRAGIRDVSWRDFTDFDTNAYMNPYTQNVVDASLSDLDRQAQIESLRRGDAQMRSGAFGGARHGVADAVAQGETARAAGALSANLRNQAFENASNRISADQQGGFGAQTANQGADVAAAQMAAQERASNQAAAAGLQGSQIQGLVAALNGGLDLGRLDLAHGGAWQGLGESSFDRLRQTGLDRSQLDASPFNMYSGLAGMLGAIPTEQGQFGTTSGNQSTQSTMSGRGRTQDQAGLNDWLGSAALIMGMF